MTSNEMTAGLLDLNRPDKTKELDQHNPVRKLRLVIKTVYLSAVLGNGGEGKDVVKVHTESGVYVVDESLDIMLGALVEQHNNLAVVLPDRCDSIKQKRQSVEPNIPKLLVLVLVAFFECDDLGNLRDALREATHRLACRYAIPQDR